MIATPTAPDAADTSTATRTQPPRSGGTSTVAFSIALASALRSVQVSSALYNALTVTAFLEHRHGHATIPGASDLLGCTYQAFWLLLYKHPSLFRVTVRPTFMRGEQKRLNLSPEGFRLLHRIHEASGRPLDASASTVTFSIAIASALRSVQVSSALYNLLVATALLEHRDGHATMREASRLLGCTFSAVWLLLFKHSDLIRVTDPPAAIRYVLADQKRLNLSPEGIRLLQKIQKATNARMLSMR